MPSGSIQFGPYNRAAESESSGGSARDERSTGRLYTRPEQRDLLAASYFNLLTMCGLRQYHYVLDVGCGSLDVGRLLIPYLLPERYFGTEPDAGAVEDGLRLELGTGILEVKRPRFSRDPGFHLRDVEGTFDYIVLQRILSHAPEAVIGDCLRAAAGCLAADGLLLGAYMPGGVDYQEQGWAYPGCAEYTDSGMSRLARGAGMDVEILDWPHPEGKTWALMYRMKRIAPPGHPSRLLERPRFEVIEPDLMESVPEAGFIDSVQHMDTALLVTGWSMNPADRVPSTHVLFADGEGRVVAFARVEIERQDVVAAHGSASRLSGFRVRIPKAAIGTGGVRAYGYAGGSVVSRLGGPLIRKGGF